MSPLLELPLTKELCAACLSTTSNKDEQEATHGAPESCSPPDDAAWKHQYLEDFSVGVKGG